MGAYGMDSHNVQRYVTREGFVRNEGNVQVGGFWPYPISCRSIVPVKEEITNLLVPVALPASHIAYSSIRMEPVFMVLGQSAATAAAMAICGQLAVQDVENDRRRERLLTDHQVVEAPTELLRGDIDSEELEGIVIDNPSARVSPALKGARTGKPVLGPAYFHDLDARDGKATARFDVKLNAPGRYCVKLHFPSNTNRATNVPVMIEGGGKSYRSTVNQRQPANWIGVYDLPAEFTVTLTNLGMNGMAVVDGLPVAPAN